MTFINLKRLAVLLTLPLIITGAAEAYIRSELDWVKPGVNVEKDQILILIKSDYSPLNISLYDGIPLTGIASLDALIDIYGVSEIKKAFFMKETPKDPSVPDLSRYYTLFFPEERDVEAVGLAFEKCTELEEVEFVRINVKYFIPNDPRYNTQWHLRHCGFPAAWEETRGSRDVKIGIIDSGMDMPFDENGDAQIHEDIVGNIWVNPGEDLDHNGVISLDDWDGQDNDHDGYADNFHGWDITGNSNWPNDIWGGQGGAGHGTHVAGIASATTNNGVGISGAAYSASLIIAACYSTRSDSLIQNGYAGIEFCGRMGAEIINCSWGSRSAPSNAERNAINYARGRGTIVFCATGNDDTEDRANDRTHFYPVAYDGVIGVAASGNSDRKADFSNYGAFTDLVAPGEAILSSIPHNRYSSYQGTSMASPLSAGLGGLILSVRDLNEAQLLAWMQRTAKDISADNGNYNGIRYRIDADFAINAIHPRYDLVESSLRELNGNDDGRADPEETCVLEIVVQDREGYADAINATATLSNPDSMIIVQREQVQLGNFGGGQQVFNGGDEGLRFVVRYNSKPHYTTFTLSVTDQSGHTDRMQIPMTIGRPKYLLVDDDDGAAYDSLMNQDLMTRPIVHDVWRVTESGSPTMEDIGRYSNLIWETGNARNGLTVAEQATLTSFLSSGGKSLVISGQFLSEDIGATDFHRNFLHAQHVADNVNERQLIGKPGSAISDSMALILIGGGGAGNSTSPSAIAPINGADTLFTYNNSGQVGGVFFNGNGYSVVYLAFALEAVSGGGRTTTRTELLHKTLDHFYTLDAPGEVSPIQPTKFALTSPYPNPFNAQTAVRVSVVPGRDFTLQVIDLSGRIVSTLHEGRSNGNGQFVWDGESASAGIYLFRLSYEGGMIVQKAALVK